jgi:hypothetical protein
VKDVETWIFDEDILLLTRMFHRFCHIKAGDEERNQIISDDYVGA